MVTIGSTSPIDQTLLVPQDTLNQIAGSDTLFGSQPAVGQYPNTATGYPYYSGYGAYGYNPAATSPLTGGGTQAPLPSGTGGMDPWAQYYQTQYLPNAQPTPPTNPVNQPAQNTAGATGATPTGQAGQLPTGNPGVYNNAPMDDAQKIAQVLATYDARIQELRAQMMAQQAQAGSGGTGSQNWQAYGQAAQQLQSTRDQLAQTAAKAANGDALAIAQLQAQTQQAIAQLQSQTSLGVAGISAGTSITTTGMNNQNDILKAMLQYGAQQDALAMTKYQFDMQFGMDWWKNATLVDQFNRQLAQNQSQFDARLAFDNRQLDQLADQFDQSFGLQWRQQDDLMARFWATFGLQSQQQGFDQAVQLNSIMANPRNLGQSLMMLGYDQGQMSGILSNSPIVQSLMNNPGSLDRPGAAVPWQSSLPAIGGPNVSWNGSGNGGAGGTHPPGSVVQGTPPSGGAISGGNGFAGPAPNGLAGSSAPVGAPLPSGSPFANLAYRPQAGANGFADQYYDPTTGRSLADLGYSSDQVPGLLTDMNRNGQTVTPQGTLALPGQGMTYAPDWWNQQNNVQPGTAVPWQASMTPYDPKDDPSKLAA